MSPGGATDRAEQGRPSPFQLIADIRTLRDAGAPDADLAQARDNQRKAQFLLDFVEAENSTGFHAPQEAMRILAQSIDFSRRGQNAMPRARPAAN